MKQKHFQYFIKVLKLTSNLSTCVSKHVACVLVKDNHILATSYNGVANGIVHCNEVFGEEVLISVLARNKHHKWSNENEQHSEANLIAYCSKEGISTKNCILFSSLSPCIACAKMILASGIKDVYYLEEYDKDKDGIVFLKNNKVKIEIV